MKSRWVILFLTLIISLSGFGQSSYQWTKTMQFSHFAPAIQDSLTEKGVLSLLRDQQGNTWFGTREGLIYYNGQELITVNDTTQSGALIRDMVVQTLFEDGESNIWLGTKSNGAVQFSNSTKTFHQYNLTASFPSTRNISSVLSYSQGRNQILWVGTFGGGVFYYDSLQSGFVPFADSTEFDRSVATSVVTSLHEDKQGILWGATFGSGLLRFDPYYQTVSQYVATHDNSSTNISDFTAVQESDDGTLWVGTYQSGLLKFDRHTTTFSHPVSALSENHIQDIHLYDTKLWIATKKQGIFCYNTQQQEVHQFTHHRDDPYSLGSDDIPIIMIDAYQTLWAVGKTNVSTALLTGFDFAILSDSTEAKQPVTALTSTQQGDVWFGTADALLYRWNSREKRLIRYDIETSGSDWLSSRKIITALEEDNQQGLWAGMSDGTLARLNLADQTWKTYTLTSNANNITSDAIESIYQDGRGTLWIGILEKGAYFWNRETDRIESVSHRFPTIPATITPKIYAENDQYLWLGTLKDGLVQLHYATGTIVHYKNYQNGEKADLPSNQITGLSLDHSGFLWVGTFDQGAGRLNTRSGMWSPFTENEGLVSNRVTSILSGPGDEIWISTIRGLSCYNIDTKEVRNYASGEFVQGNEFVQYCASSGQSAYYFGTLDGVIQITNAPKAKPSNNPPLVATRLTSSRQSISLAAPTGISHHVELTYDENAFEIFYSLQQFPFQAKSQYEYILQGLDKQWRRVGSRTLATYTNLPPGSYQFLIRATSAQNELVKTDPLLIVIHPAWYQTVWFKLIVALTALLLITALYYYRMASVERSNRILEDLVNKRTQELVSKNQYIEQQHKNITFQNQQLEEAKAIIDQKNDDLLLLNQDLEERVQQRTQELAQTNEALYKSNEELDLFVYRAYHDIIGPIARIEGLCQVASMEATGQPTMEDYLQRLLDNCHNARISLQKVLHIHHVRHHQLKYSLVNTCDFIHKLYQKTTELFPDYPAPFPQFILECENTLHVETDTELLTLILQAFLKNAIQYAIQSPEAYVRVAINHSENTGIQISVEDNGEGVLPELRDKLFTMFFRGHETKSGTGLDLYIAQLSAERLRAKVKYHSEADHTRFSLTLPLCKENGSDPKPILKKSNQKTKV